jgi:hypothetical protein
MSGIKKLVGITGLNTEHPLFNAVSRFINIDAEIKDIVTNTTYTSTAVVTDDPDLGICREFDANGDVISPTVPIAFNSTVLAIYKYLGGAAQGIPINDTFFFQYIVNGNQFVWQSLSTSSADYRTNRRFAFGTSVNTEYEPYNQNVTQKRTPRASAISYSAGTPFFYSNGVAFTPVTGATGATGTPSINPIPVALMPTIGSNGAIRVSAFVVFNRLLTAAELTDITQNPWNLTVGTLPLEVAISPAALTPNATITATLTNYSSLPTSVTIEDSRGNDIVLPLTQTSATTATFTVPNLPSVDGNSEYIQFGNVSLTFGAKTISSTFSVGATKTLSTQIDPVSQYLFASFPSVVSAGDQLVSTTSEGVFDSNGNFLSDVEGTFRIWCVYKTGNVYSEELSTESTSTSFSEDLIRLGFSVSPKDLTLDVGSSFISDLPLTNFYIESKPLDGVFGVSFIGEIPKLSYNVSPKTLTLTSGVGFIEDLPKLSLSITSKTLGLTIFKAITIDPRRVYKIK